MLARAHVWSTFYSEDIKMTRVIHSFQIHVFLSVPFVVITSHKSPKLGTHQKESIFKFYFVPNLCNLSHAIYKWQLISTRMRICNKKVQEDMLFFLLQKPFFCLGEKMLHLNWAVYFTEAQCGVTSKLRLTRRLEKRIITTSPAIFNSVCCYWIQKLLMPQNPCNVDQILERKYFWQPL